jgi:hypothetical protein
MLIPRYLLILIYTKCFVNTTDKIIRLTQNPTTPSVPTKYSIKENAQISCFFRLLRLAELESRVAFPRDISR